ncbi:hypothetical protein FKM82_005006 [Ascaphus truei]
MKAKFKETIDKCDSLEHRLNDLLKEKQAGERSPVCLPNWKVHPTKCQSIEALCRAERRARNEQMPARQSGAASSQAPRGGEHAEGFQPAERHAARGDARAAPRRHVLPGGAAENQPAASRGAPGDPGRADQRGIFQFSFRVREAASQEGARETRQIRIRERSSPGSLQTLRRASERGLERTTNKTF